MPCISTSDIPQTDYKRYIQWFINKLCSTISGFQGGGLGGDLDFGCNLYQTNFAIMLRAEWDQSKNIRKYFFHIEYDFFFIGHFLGFNEPLTFFQEFYYSQGFWSKSLPWITPNYTHLQNNFSWRRTVNWLIIFCTTEDKMTTRTARKTETW